MVSQCYRNLSVAILAQIGVLLVQAPSTYRASRGHTMPEKVPTAILRAREKLTQLGLAITVENLEKHLDGTEINKAMGSMRHAMKGHQHAKDVYGAKADTRSRHS